MICLVPIFCLLHFVHCQEAPLLECSPNFYRDEDSVCRFCDENACKAVLENKGTKYEDCRPHCPSTAQLKPCPTSFTTTSQQIRTKQPFDKDTKYKDCRSHCLSKTSARPYPTFTRSKDKGTRQPYDTSESNKWLWFLIPAFLVMLMIGILVGLMMAHGYTRFKNINPVNSALDFVKEVLMTGMKTCCFTRIRDRRNSIDIPSASNGRSNNEIVITNSQYTPVPSNGIGTPSKRNKCLNDSKAINNQDPGTRSSNMNNS